MLDRKKILKRAYDECLTEMYFKAQPSVDYNQLLQDIKDGKINENELVYERYYLSHDEFIYILNKYKNAYKLSSSWNENIELLKEYLKIGGTKDKYIEPYTDKDGNYHSGYRGYEKVLPLDQQFEDIMKKCFCGFSYFENKLKNKLIKCVFDNIENCENFYSFDNENCSFSASISLGPSPTSNKNTVIEYWKTQGIDIEIEERNPLLFWDKDYYGDEFEEVMEEEYGENWKEYFDNKWKEEQNKKD